MFRSDRVRERAQGPNALSAARDAIVASGGEILDLVSGSQSAGGPGFPPESLEEAVRESFPRAATYLPDPLGRLEAREAISSHYDRGGGVRVPPDRILVTPGTSVSYLYAFSILCEPGDDVLVPRPSYPLFDEIARVAGVRAVPYWLREADGWRIDLESVESRVSTRTRAVVLISPHNPTGSVATEAEIEGLAEIARRHDLAILADEVFDGFVFEDAPRCRARGSGAPLVLTLDGFSKMLALPGWKIGWIAITGDDDRAAAAAWMLAHVADSFLPVNEWAQCAVPGILRRGDGARRLLRERARRGRDLLLERLALPGVTSIVPPAGGLFATVRLLGGRLHEEALALDLLARERLLVHPGAFYDIPPDHLVLSYAAGEERLGPALEAIAAALEASRPA
jgi:aspartate/methionine/tyrosine aminotransferase